MKKILIIISIFALFLSNSQGQVRVLTGGAIQCPNYFYLGGGTADTLANKDTLTWVVRVYANTAQRMYARLDITKVSGTISDTTYLYGSFDGTTLDNRIDSISNTTNASSVKYSTTANWTAFTYPYLIIKNICRGHATLRTNRKMYIIMRDN